tara:strand:+ start:4037 stop:4684 length:648 start_codon:yes stop_codon:yes gene_type:complete
MVAKDESHTLQAAPSSGDDLPPARFEDAEPDVSEAPKAVALDEQVKQLQKQVESLQSELEAATKKADDSWQQLLRKEADMQNMQKRVTVQVDSARKFALERFAAELLQVADSLEQGLSLANSGHSDSAGVFEGLALTNKALVSVMEKEGIQQLNPEGEAFNPTFHEAISMQETTDFEPNQVMEVVQKGYLLNDRLIRPARVVVSRASTSDSAKDT